MPAPKGNKNHYKHGLSHTRINNIYKTMKSRCYKRSNIRFNRYGARGIRICDEWLGEDGFINFCEWSLKNGYSENLTIDRIDINGNYSPLNCRWVSQKQQQNNRSNTIHIIYNGEDKTLSEWSEITGVKRKTLWNRYNEGWTEREILYGKG